VKHGITHGITIDRWMELLRLAKFLESGRGLAWKTRATAMALLDWSGPTASGHLLELTTRGYAERKGNGRGTKYRRTAKHMPLEPPRFDGPPPPKKVGRPGKPGNPPPKAKVPKPVTAKVPKPVKAKVPKPQTVVVPTPAEVGWHLSGVRLDELASLALKGGHLELYRALRQAATESYAVARSRPG